MRPGDRVALMCQVVGWVIDDDYPGWIQVRFPTRLAGRTWTVRRSRATTRRLAALFGGPMKIWSPAQVI
jgi:hypothetical protein